MPETSPRTEAPNVAQQCQKVRSLLTLNPQKLTTIQTHLGLTKPQTLSIMQRLEEHQEVYCEAGVWHLSAQ